MPYLNVDLDYFDHRKTKRLIGLIGRGAEVLPIRLWAYCGKHHSEDGRLAGYSDQEIEANVGWWGKAGEMMPALKRAGFVDNPNGCWEVHAWEEHQGHIAAFKLKGAAMAKARWDKARADAASIAASNTTSNAQKRVGIAGSVRPEPEGDARGEIDRVNYLKDSLCVLFGRPKDQAIPCMDQLAMVEIVKRAGVADEILLIKKLKTSPYEFFPRSLSSLLQNWDKTVDTARNYQDTTKPKEKDGSLTIIHGKELERIMARLIVLNSTYGDHQTWTPGDRAEKSKLIARRNELRTELGVTI